MHIVHSRCLGEQASSVAITKTIVRLFGNDNKDRRNDQALTGSLLPPGATAAPCSTSALRAASWLPASLSPPSRSSSALAPRSLQQAHGRPEQGIVPQRASSCALMWC